MKKLLLSILTLALLLTSVTPAQAAYTYIDTVTIDHTKVAATLANFPVVINFTDGNLATIANAGHMTSANGYDYRLFTSNDCATVAYTFELVYYNATTGQIELWFNQASLSSTVDTVLYGCLGNSSVTTDGSSTSTWPSQYLMVQHLPNGITASANDSTSGANNGTLTASPSATTGQIDGGIVFNGTSQYITFANESNFDFQRTDSFTLSTWVNTGTNKASQGMFMKEDASNSFQGYGIFQRSGGTNSTIAFEIQSSADRIAVRTNNEYAAGTWHYVVATYSGNSNVSGQLIYVDGSSQALTTIESTGLANSILNNIAIQLSGRNGANFLSNQTLDEPRVSNTASASTWITTEYNNQSGGAFMTHSFAAISAGSCVPKLSLLGVGSC